MRIRQLMVTVSVFAVWLAASPGTALAAGTYRLTDLGTLGGPSSSAEAINAAGQVVGVSDTPDGHQHPFLWSAGRMIDLGTLGGPDGIAHDINTAGQIVGESTTASGDRHAFLWFRGRMTDLGAPGDVESQATAINDAGTIVGSVSISGSDVQGFQWRAGRRTLLAGVAGSPSADTRATDINTAGDIVGIGGGSRQIVRWHNAVPTVLFQTGSFTQSVITPRINSSGDIVAFWYSSHMPFVFWWHDGVANQFLAQGSATGINDNHDFVGDFQFPPSFSGSRPYLDHGGTALVDLTTQGIPATSSLVAINNAGRIAATLTFPGFTTHAATYTP